MTEAIRTLKIKAGTVKRYDKDLSYSKQECQTERQRLHKLRDDGGDEYEIRAQEKVVADADQMVPNYKNRLEIAIAELEALTVRSQD